MPRRIIDQIILGLDNSRSKLANFADIIKIATMLIKTIFKDSKKLKQLEIMY